MLNLTRAIDRATGYIFVPPAVGAQQHQSMSSAGAGAGASTTGPDPNPDPGPGPGFPGPGPGPGAEPPRSALPNASALMSSAMGSRVGMRSDVRDVQERWVDARDEWDAYERTQWRREGEEALRRTGG
jgi:hypothetical protein